MSTLDEKLKLLVGAGIQFERLNDAPEFEPLTVNINGHWIRVHLPYEAIKQAFIDEGWIDARDYVKWLSDRSKPTGVLREYYEAVEAKWKESNE